MIFTVSKITLQPDQTIQITANPGSVMGTSQPYLLVVELNFPGENPITMNWQLTIVNANFYRFGDRSSINVGTLQVAASLKQVFIQFAIQNIANVTDSTPPLNFELQLNDANDASSHQTVNKLISMIFTPSTQVDGTFIID
jgi:hypothetical protein